MCQQSTLLMASDLDIGREARHIGHELSTRTNNVHDLLRFSFLSSSPIDCYPTIMVAIHHHSEVTDNSLDALE